MRVLLRTSDDRIIEAQSGDDESNLEILYDNAKASGLKRKDVTAVVMPDAEFHAKLAAQNDADMDYRQRRAREYPSLADQLDMIWHAIHNGVTLDHKSDFYHAIADVKAKHPKP